MCSYFEYKGQPMNHQVLPESDVPWQQLKKAIAEWVKRMQRKHETLKSISTDVYIDCPKCDSLNSIVWGYDEWRCHWFHCRFKIPYEVTPPSPNELEEIFKAHDRERKLQRLNEFLSETDVQI